MSSEIDKQVVLDYYQKMTDEQITNALTKDLKGLTMEAQEIVKEEIRRRNLNPDFIKVVDVQQEAYIHIPKEFDPYGCPVEEEARIWLEKSFLFLLNIFEKEKTLERIILIPSKEHFPIRYDGSEKSALETLKIIAKQMEVPIENITLDFYDEDLMNITEGSPGGLYSENNSTGKFEISIVRKLLDEPENMVATLAHEVAHIKLMGEKKLHENDEKITDLTTIFFGCGIFNANAAFQTFAGSRYYGWSTSGYLTQMEWGYAMALFALIRNEDEPAWAKYLCTNVKADLRQSQNFIFNNEDKISVGFFELWMR